jgi:DUF971 family protein
MDAQSQGTPVQPIEITQMGRDSLRVRWADGHESDFPLPQLRLICRCALCRTAEPPPPPTSTSPFRVLGPEPSAEPSRLEQVGNYALGVTWKDSHHSIFAFDLLRHECPCGECAARRAAEDR